MKNRLIYPLLLLLSAILLLALPLASCTGDRTEEESTTTADTNPSPDEETTTAESESTPIDDNETETTTEAETYNTDVYGVLSVRDVYAWVDYPASDFYLHFSKPEMAEEVRYEYDTEALSIDAALGTIRALKPGQHPVTVIGEHFKTTFLVNAETVDKDAIGSQSTKKYDTTPYDEAVLDRQNDWAANGSDGKTTIFIGDSFFDSAFWPDFHTNYAGKSVLRIGISATTSYDWEQFAEGWLCDFIPKNMVMHIGSNNIYDDGDDAATTVSALQRMFTVMHDYFPDTGLYWFSITQRDTQEKRDIVEAVNTAMQAWCEERSYITYMHTVDDLTPELLVDTVHPTAAGYEVFVKALQETDIVIDEGPLLLSDVTNTIDKTISNDGNGILDLAGDFSGDFVLSGKLDITELGFNAHIQFGVDTDQKRFLLWNRAFDGNMYMWLGTDESLYENSVDPATSDKVTGPATAIEWKLLRYRDICYFFIGGELRLVASDFGGDLIIGSENTACRFYDMTLLTGQVFQEVVGSYGGIIDRYGAVVDNGMRV